MSLLEEMKPVVAIKDDFACRAKSEVIAYFGSFGLSRFSSEGKINNLISQSISTSFKFLVETKMEDTKPLVTEN